MSNLNPSENPKKWRFYWESQSQLPILKLQLFNPKLKPPLIQCTNLKLQNSVLELRWLDSENEVLVTVPVPKVLVDSDSPVTFKVLEDCIEVKVCLLLSVDHPMISSLISLDEGPDVEEMKPLRMDYGEVLCFVVIVYLFYLMN